MPLLRFAARDFLRLDKRCLKVHRRLTNVNVWTVSAAVIMILLFLPNLTIVAGVFTPANENWIHMKEFVLGNYIKTSLILVSATALLTIFIGLSLAWLIAQYQFPLRGN